MLERVSALVQNQVSLYSKTCFNELFGFFVGGGGGREGGPTCDMIRKKKPKDIRMKKPVLKLVLPNTLGVSVH